MNPESLIGQIIGERYKIVALLGTGGMAVVYKAVQLGLGRFVAIKLMHSGLVQDKDSRARFEREAAALSLLSHNNIATFYSYGLLGGASVPSTDVSVLTSPYIVMEYLEGKSLREVLSQEERMPWPRVVKIIGLVCEAMAYAHGKEIIHRDLKPNNIVLIDQPEKDWVKVVDFGLARGIDLSGSDAQKLTHTGALIGSVAYMSPEQCEGKVVDKRSDIYALGCVLYELLCGEVPLQADNPIGLMHKHVNEVPLSFSGKLIRETLPTGLEECVFKALEKDPDKRYQRMDAFAADLELIGRGQGERSQAAMEGHAGKSRQANSRTINAKLVAISFALVAVSGLLYLWSDSGLSLITHFLLGQSTTAEQASTVAKFAEVVEGLGRKKIAEEIKASLVQSIDLYPSKSLQPAVIYLKFAEKAYASGDKKSACSWAERAISYVNTWTANDDSDEKPLLWLQALDIVNGSVHVIKQSQALFSHSFLDSLAGRGKKEKRRLVNPRSIAYLSDYIALLAKSLAVHQPFNFSARTNQIRSLADSYASKGELDAALFVYKGLGDDFERKFGKNSLQAAAIETLQAGILADMGKRDQSLSLLKRIEKTVKSRTDQESPEVSIDLWWQLEMAYGKLYMRSEELRCANKRYELACRWYGQSYPVETVLYDMGRLQQVLMPEKAVALAQEDLALTRKLFPPGAEEIVYSRTLYFEILGRCGRGFEPVIKAYEQAEHSLEAAPKEYFNELLSLYRYGMSFGLAGYTAQAQEAFKKYSVARKKYAGDSAREERRGLLARAVMLEEEGRYWEAEKSYLEIVKLCENLSWDSKEALCYLFDLYAILGADKQRDEIIDRWRKMPDRTYGDQSCYFERHLLKQALMQKNMAEAEWQLKKIVARFKVMQGSPWMKGGYLEAAVAVAFAKKAWPETEAYAKELLDLAEYCEGRLSQRYLNTSLDFGLILCKAGKQSEAETLAKSTFDTVKNVYPRALMILRSSACLESIWLEQGKFAQAEELAQSLCRQYAGIISLPEERSFLTMNKILLADALLKQHKLVLADAEISGMIKGLEEETRIDLPFCQSSLLTVANYELRSGRPKNAERLVQLLLDSREKMLLLDFTAVEEARRLERECNLESSRVKKNI